MTPRRPIFLYTRYLAPFGGIEKQLTLLALELVKRRYDLVLFLHDPVEPLNRYYSQLHHAGIRVVAPSGLGTRFLFGRCGLVHWLLVAASPLLGLACLVRAALYQEGFPEAWDWLRRKFYGAFGRANVLLFDATAFAHLLVHCVQRRPALLHVFRVEAEQAIGWARLLRIPSLYTEGGTPSPATTWWNKLPRVINDASLITAMCQAGKEGLETYCSARRPIWVIPSAAEAPATTLLDRCRRGNVVVGYAGRLTPEKGVGYLIDAAAVIAREDHDVRFLIAGNGPQRLELQRLVAVRGLTSVVKFPGDYDPDKVADFMLGIDIFVLPSLTEGLPTTIVEAMSYAKPVVATSVGGIPEIVRHAETGLIVPPSDPSLLAIAIAHLIRCPDLRQQMGQKALEDFQRAYTPAKVVERLLQAYQAVCPGLQIEHSR